MRKLWGTSIAVTLIAVGSIAAPSASAATEIGNNCVATTAPPGYTMVQLAKAPGSSLPLAATGPGVVTKWKVRLPSVPGTFPQTLKVFRPVGGNAFNVIAENTQNIGTGESTFDVRVPVQAGDRLGLYGSGSLGALACVTSNTADVLGTFIGNIPIGSTQNFTANPGLQVAVSGLVEPDADGDGYGDETQDKCPQNAAVQVPCPVVALSTSASAKRGLANVLITASSQAAVTVGGTVKLGKGKTATLSGGTQVVLPGVISKFTLLFGQKLKEKLKSLSRKRSLTLNLTASAPNVVGAPTVSALSVKLKGQKKPKRHRPKGGK